MLLNIVGHVFGDASPVGLVVDPLVGPGEGGQMK